MEVTSILFYVISALIIIESVMVVTVKNILHSAIHLIFTFIAIAALYIMLSAEFVAITQVLVYIGGIVVFVIFAVLLTHRLGEKEMLTGSIKKGSAALLALALFAVIVSAIMQSRQALAMMIPAESDMESIGGLSAIGRRFLDISESGYIVPFEVVSLLLLAAIIAAIAIGRVNKEKES
jgi:NADH-quinone oxidoreductase subunit J